MADAKGAGPEISTTLSASDGLPVSDDAAISSTLQEPASDSRWRRFLGFFWDSLDGDLRDRKYIQKLDTYLLYVHEEFLSQQSY